MVMLRMFALLIVCASVSLISCAALVHKNVSLSPEAIYGAPVKDECGVQFPQSPTIYYVKVFQNPQQGWATRIYGSRTSGHDLDRVMLIDKIVPGRGYGGYTYEGYLMGTYGWARQLQWDQAQEMEFNHLLSQFRSLQQYVAPQCRHHMAPLYNELNRYFPSTPFSYPQQQYPSRSYPPQYPQYPQRPYPPR